MFQRHSCFRAVLLCVSFFCLAPVSRGTTSEAWDALNRLDIPKAKELFKEELKKNPKDISLLRGQMLAAHFNLDHADEVQAVRNMVAADPANPSLLAVFEHVAATMTDWGEALELQQLIGSALAKNAPGAVAHVGRQMLRSVAVRAADPSNTALWRALGDVPGGWLAGPFENSSNIAAYRRVTWEGEPLDTSAITTGSNGAEVGWTWRENNPMSNISPAESYTDNGMAYQCRVFFDLPKDMAILISTGGTYSGRYFIDGVKMYDNGTYRNSTQREVFRVALKRGAHEISAVLTSDSLSISWHLGILDSAYQEIKGIKYPRFASVAPDPSLKPVTTHPIFDSFDAYTRSHGADPDSRYFRADLLMYNAQADEAIKELERARDSAGITPLESYALLTALRINDENIRANEVLNALKDSTSSPLVEFYWTSQFVENPEERVNALAELDTKYPNRMEIQLGSSLKPLFSGDLQGTLANLEALSKRYPNAASGHTLASTLYQTGAHDVKTAIQELIKASQIGGNQAVLYQTLPSMYASAGDWDNALKQAKAYMALYPGTDFPRRTLANVCLASSRAAEGIPLLEPDLRRERFNANIRSYLYDLYTKNGQFDRAQEMLRAIHTLKPAAVRPYLNLDSLRNNYSLDTIFGSIDPMSIWDVTPSAAELGGSNQWLLLDRRQNLVFGSGIVARDIQMSRVLLDQEAVKKNQEWNFESTVNSPGGKLLVARRLRKGQPALSAQVKEGHVVFQDLRPGDAIDLHYRFWEANRGDLWHEFWSDYDMYSSVYQRFAEFNVMSNRDDLKYVVSPPVDSPKVSTYCGFRKYSWVVEKAPAWRLDLSLLPPTEDITGRITFSTISDWNMINRWYASISDAVLGDNPRARELAEHLVTSGMTDMEKLRALYKHIVLNIPYQTIDFGYDAAIPHKPDEVLINRWGDCKDKAHLLIQMLREVGMTAWPVLVKTRADGSKMLLPEFAFNHLIVGCLIDNDTLFVDPSSASYPPDMTLGQEVVRQPRLDVTSNRTQTISRLPDPKDGDSRWTMTMIITPQAEGACRLTYRRRYYNHEAGSKRDDLAGTSLTTLKDKIASDFSSTWAVALTIDSLSHDTLESIDSVFNETWWGTIGLNIQKIGKTTLMNRPDWSIIPKSLLAELAVDGKRDFPVDLTSYYGDFTKTLEIHVPESFGTPRPLPPVTIKDSLWTYTYSYTWDLKTRVLSLSYALKLDDGMCDWQKFAALSKTIIETFDSPLLFEKN